MVFKKKIFKDFLYIFLCKNSSPTVASPYHWTIILTNLNLYDLEMLPLRFGLSWPNSFEKKIFLEIFSMYKNVSPIVAPPYPQGPWFEQTWIYIIWGWLPANLSFLGHIVFEKKIFKDFLYIFLCKTWSPNCGPTLPPGTMIWTNLYLHYMRMLPLKVELFWHNSFWEEYFERFSLNIPM